MEMTQLNVFSYKVRLDNLVRHILKYSCIFNTKISLTNAKKTETQNITIHNLEEGHFRQTDLYKSRFFRHIS